MSTKPSSFEADEIVHVVKRLNLQDDFQTENALRVLIDYSVDGKSSLMLCCIYITFLQRTQDPMLDFWVAFQRQWICYHIAIP